MKNYPVRLLRPFRKESTRSKNFGVGSYVVSPRPNGKLYLCKDIMCFNSNAVENVDFVFMDPSPEPVEPGWYYAQEILPNNAFDPNPISAVKVTRNKQGELGVAIRHDKSFKPLSVYNFFGSLPADRL